jgi:hypothetical protein
VVLKNIGVAIGVGLYWFLIGSFIGFIVFEGFVDPDGKIADIWPAVLGYPGFFGGVTFYTLTRIVERRRLHEVSYLRAAIWGALSGPLLMALFLLGMTTGILGDFRGDRIPWTGLAQATGMMVPAFAMAGWFSVWMAKQVAAPPGTRAAVSE